MTVRDPEGNERDRAVGREAAMFTRGRTSPWVLLTVAAAVVTGALLLSTTSTNAPRPGDLAAPSSTEQPVPPLSNPATVTPGAEDPLTADSTLARWLAATADERTPIAVALARNFLKADASKLEIARAAMEITGCLTRTAKDPKLSAWKVAPTANICLTAPERPR